MSRLSNQHAGTCPAWSFANAASPLLPLSHGCGPAAYATPADDVVHCLLPSLLRTSSELPAIKQGNGSLFLCGGEAWI